MAIRGDLLSADLSNVFQMLALNRKSGQLTVQEQGNLLNKRRLYVHEDRVALHEAAPERPILALLVELGIISYAQYEEVLVKGDRYRSNPVKLLEQQGLLDEAKMEVVRRREEEESILEVFLWRNVIFELDDNAAPPGPETPWFGIDHLIMESARRQDEWAQFVEIAGVNRQIYVRASHLGPSNSLELDPIPRIVLDSVDGVRGSGQIVAMTGLPRYYVDLSLRGLQDGNYIEPLGLSDLINTGDRLMDAGDPESGLRLFRAALPHDRRNLTLHERLARAYLAAGRIAKASAHYRFCAMSLLASGRRRDALQIYQSVLRLLPTDFKTLQRALELMAQEGAVTTEDDSLVIDQSRKLLSFFVDTQQDRAAVGIADRILDLQPDDEGLLALSAKLHLKYGENDRAVRAYAKLASARHAADDLDGAREIYRTLAGIDTANRHLYQAKIADIHRIRDVERRRRRRKITAVLGALVVLTTIVGYGVYSWAARSELSRLEEGLPEAEEEATRRISRLSEVAAAYPLTPASFDAQSRIRAIEADQTRRREELEEKQRQERERRHASQAEADRLYQEGLAHIGASDLVPALTAFRSAVDRLKPGDRWRFETEAATQIRSIEQYLSEGNALLQEAREAEAVGQIGRAHDLLVRLAADYFNLPELKGRPVEIPVRLLVSPKGAHVTVRLPDGHTVQGQGEISLKLPYGTRVEVEASLSGYESVQITLDPTSRWDYPVVLSRSSRSSTNLDDDVQHLVSLADGRLLVASPTGRVGTYRSGTSRPQRWERASASLVGPSRLHGCVAGYFVASDSGIVRLHDPDDLRIRWESRAGSWNLGGRIVAMDSVGGDLLLCCDDGKGVFRLQKWSARDGQVIFDQELTRRPVGMATSPRGVAVLATDGSLHFFDGETGKKGPVLSGPYCGLPSRTADGRLAVFKSRVGVCVMNWDGGDEGVALASDEEDAVGAPEVTGRSCLQALPGGFVLVGAGATASRISVGAEVVNLKASGDWASVVLENGRVLVINARQRELAFSAAASCRSAQGVVLHEGELVIGAANRRLHFIALE